MDKGSTMEETVQEMVRTISEFMMVVTVISVMSVLTVSYPSHIHALCSSSP